MATAAGVVKKVRTVEFQNAKTRGIIAIRLDEGDKLVSAILSSGKDELVLITRRGQALRVAEDEVRAMGRSSRGVTGIRLSQGDELAAAIHVEEESKMLVLSESGYGKRVEFSEFTPHGRGTGGQRVYKVNEKTGEVVGAITVADCDEVVVITSQGKTLRLHAKKITTQGRGAGGICVFNIEKPDMVIGVDKVANEEDDKEKNTCDDPILDENSDSSSFDNNSEEPYDAGIEEGQDNNSTDDASEE